MGEKTALINIGYRMNPLKIHAEKTVESLGLVSK